MAIICSKLDFRKFLLSKQFLLQPRQLQGPQGIITVFNTLRTIQYDPQDICGRNVDLVLGARISGIAPSDYYDWLYGQRKGIETYDKELSVIPIEDIPHSRGTFPPARQKKLDFFLENNTEKLNALLNFIQKNGPTCSLDLEGKEKVNIFWESASWNKVALDALYKDGKLVITKREGNRRYYDLPEKVYGKNIQHRTSGAELKQEHILRRVAAVGALPVSGVSAGWLGLGKASEINQMIQNLIKIGKLIEINIKEIKRTYIINANDLKNLIEIHKTEIQKKVSFLPPLDNLLWDREMVKEIFDFDYKWEAYTPADKRKYGHYVLPILYGTDFIGRISPKFDKKSKTLEIHGLWSESPHKWSKETRSAFELGIHEFRRFLRAEKISWKNKIPKILERSSVDIYG